MCNGSKMPTPTVSSLLLSRKTPRTGGVLLSKLTSRDELNALLATDPFYQQQLARYEVIEFEASMVAAGFEVLK